MTASTQGLHIRTGSRALSAAVELLSSMRFSISLLSVICIASVIGTVVKQHEPANNYVNQFGPFWADVFGSAQLFTVYSAWWFLLILAFLVVSTSLCIARNAPKILADLRNLKEGLREQSLRSFPHRAEGGLDEAPEAAAHRMGQTLLASGWKVKLQSRDTPHGVGWMVAAKKGAANKLGYLAAHSAIVLVCLGGLLDGDLIVRAQMWFNDKTPFTGGGMIADVPPQHRLPRSNPTFRGNLLVTEGTSASTAILNQSDGVLLQDLPFSVELKKFIVEYYDTGMPRLFASEIVVHDHDTGEKTAARVEVNHPFKHRGVNIFQSSFEDGGSKVTLRGVPINGLAAAQEVSGTIGGAAKINNGLEPSTLEFTGLRVINVENFGQTEPAAGTDVRSVNLGSALQAQLGAGHKTQTEKTLRNVGPSVSYKLRDAAGQAVEYQNYMLPMDIDGNRVYLLGLRESPSDPFRYLRIPADDQDSMDGFLRLRAALANPDLRRQAVRRYAAGAVDSNRPELVEALAASADRAMDLYAGVQPVGAALNPELPTPAAIQGGLQAVSAFLESNVPQAERERASGVLVRILNGSLFELLQLSREQAGLAPLPLGEKTQAFMTQAVLSVSDTFFYPAAMSFQLKDFEHVQASVFQVTRAPGQNVVYLGCLLLILGVFAMLYVRDRRVWVWLSPRDGGGADGRLALSTNRRTMAADHEFDVLKNQLLKVTP